MITSSGLRIVASVCEDPAREREFNEWYNTYHVPEVLARIPGAKSATRFEVVGQKPGEAKYIAVYEIDGAPPTTFDSYREKMHAGQLPAFTPGPGINVLWRLNCKRIISL